MRKNGFIKVLIIVVALLLLIGFCAGIGAAATPISSCTEISSPGEYVLTQDIIDSSATYCMNVTSNNVVFDCQGHIIDGSGTLFTYGVYVHNSATILTNVTVKNLEVSDWYIGIYFRNVDSGNLTGNNAHNNKYDGINLHYSGNSTLKGNNALNNTHGIYLIFSSNNTFTGNTANNNTNNGIHLLSSSNNTLSSNNAHNNGIGIYIHYSSNNTLSSNNAHNNTYYGIYLSSSSNNTLNSNNANFNYNYGIYLLSSSNNTIYNNYFNNTNNVFFGFTGTIYSNKWNTTKTPGKNIVGGNYLGGNFWADPSGTGFSQTCNDSDDDGICDTSYTLASDNVDYLPLAVPPPPTLISWSNNITNDKQTDVGVERLAYVKFNATSNQSILVWSWFKDGVNQNHNYDNITLNWNSIGLKTVKVNASNVYGISNTITWNVTVQDILPPAPVTDLTNNSGNFWINWTWANPSNDDFSHVMIYINGNWKINTSNKFYNATYWPHANQTISTRTVDIHGNINNTWVNQTTQIPNNNITIFDIPSTETINENETLYIDVNATDLDGDSSTFYCNRTDLFKDFNITTGKGNFTPTYAQSGVYAVDFGVSDGNGSTSNKTMMINVVEIPLTITSYWNNKTGNSLILACWQNDSIQFGVTTNRTANAMWYYDSILEQNSSSLNYTKQFTAAGEHYVNVSTYDQYDHNPNITFTVTVSVAAITASETQTKDYIQANNSTTLTYSRTSIVNSLAIITNTNLTNVSIEVQELANVSSNLFMVDVSGKSYAYFNIISTNLSNADLTSVGITFTVNKSWLQNSGLDPNNVKLNRYHNNSWEVYSAIKINETSTNITCIATNIQGLSIFAITAFSISAPTPQPSEGAGGGGGRGAAFGEPYENIADTEVRYILALTTNKQNIVEFKKSTHHILEISFAYSQVANEVSATIEKLINSSLLARGAAPGVVYENDNIWVNVPNPSYVSKASIKFYVDKSWISRNNVDSNSIAMHRFKDGAWSKLTTHIISENETLIFYLASTPGFSPFAIAGEKLSAVAIATPTPGPAELPTTPTATPTPPTPTPTKPVTGFNLTIAAIGVITAIYLRKRRF